MNAVAKRDTDEAVDNLHRVMRHGEPVDCPVTHRFTPGLYSREIFMPAGTLIISKIHKTEHPYVVSKGKVAVWTAEAGVQRIQAPFTGITKPGTRRVLLIVEDCVWTTFHPTTETDVDKIEAQIIEPREVTDKPVIDVKTVDALKEEAKCLGLQ